MLAIKKRHKAVKVITAGSIAFAVGLTGVAAYIDRSLQHENFALEQIAPETAQQAAPTAAPETAENVQGASIGAGTATPQAAGSTQALAPAPTTSQSAAPVASVPAPAPVTSTSSTRTVTSPTVAPGMGGGSGGGSESPDKEENLTDLVDQVLDVLPSL